MQPFSSPRTWISVFGVFRNFSLSLAKTGVSLLANLAFVLMSARAFSQEQVAVIAVAGIGTMLMDAGKGLGIGNLLLRRLPRMRESDPAAGKLIRAYLFYSLLPPLLLAGVGAAMAAPLSRYFFGSAVYAHNLLVASIFSLFTVLTNTNLLVLQARQRFGLLAGLSMASAALQRIVPCLTLVGGAASLDRFFLWAAAGSAIGVVLSSLPLLPALATRGEPALTPFSEIWLESRHFYYTTLLRYTSTQIDQLFVAALFAPSTLAVYYMLRRLYSIGAVTIGSLMDALAPDLSRQAGSDLSAARGRLSGWLRVLLYTGTILAAVLAGYGGPLMDLLLGPGYGNDAVLISLFAVSTVTYFLHGFVQMDVALFQDPRKSLRLALVTAAANWIAGPLASLWIGVHSIPLAMIAGHLIGIATLGRNGPGRLWQPAQTGVSLGVIGLASAVSIGVQQYPGVQPGFPRWAAIALIVVAFSWTQYSNWQMHSCWRQLTEPAA